MQPVLYLYRLSIFLIIFLLMAPHLEVVAGLTLSHETDDSGTTATPKPVDPLAKPKVPGVSGTLRPTVPKGASLPLKEKGTAVRPQLPGIIKNNSRSVVTPIVAQLSATLANYDNGDNGQQWNTMVRNLGSKALTANRYELKVLQLLDVLGQTAPAGPSYFLPHLPANGQQGFSSGWTRHPRARKIRLEVWDTIARANVLTKILTLPSMKDQLSSGSASVAQLTSPGMITAPQLIIESGKYLGRGAWQLQIKSNNMPFAAASHAYKWSYRFASDNGPAQGPKDITFPVPAGVSRIILEPSEFYGPQDGDCAGLKEVDIELFHKQTGAKQNYTIPVRIPNVEVVTNYPRAQDEGNKRPVYVKATNHSHYNLLLEYSLKLTLKKMGEHGPIIEHYETTGPFMLPANQTTQDRVLVPDLYAVLPSLEHDDEHGRDPILNDTGFSKEFYMENLPPMPSPGMVYINAFLTIAMPANSKCGQGRPLYFVKRSGL